MIAMMAEMAEESMSALEAQPEQIMEVIWSQLQEGSDEPVSQSMEGQRWFDHTADRRYAGAVRRQGS